MHESGAVGGILNTVSENEGLLLDLIERGRAEQVRQGHREQRGNGASHEADAVALLARGAVVVLGLLAGVGPRVSEYGDDVTVDEIGVVFGWSGVLEYTVLGVEPAQPLYLRDRARNYRGQT